MASLPYPLNCLYNHGRVGMAGMPYPPTDCRSYIKINMNTYQNLFMRFNQNHSYSLLCVLCYTESVVGTFFH